jgi:hypothetical protein
LKSSYFFITSPDTFLVCFISSAILFLLCGFHRIMYVCVYDIIKVAITSGAMFMLPNSVRFVASCKN